MTKSGFLPQTNKTITVSIEDTAPNRTITFSMRMGTARVHVAPHSTKSSSTEYSWLNAKRIRYYIYSWNKKKLALCLAEKMYCQSV